MRKWTCCAFTCGLALATAIPALASEAYTGFTDISFSVIDLDPNDGIAPSFTVLGGTLTAALGTGPAGPASADSSTAIHFDSWPTGSLSVGGTAGDGAFAAYAFGPDSITAWGNSGAAGSFYSTLFLSIDVLVSPNTQLLMSSHLLQGMNAPRAVHEGQLGTTTLAATDAAIFNGGGFALLGDGGPFRDSVTGDFNFSRYGGAGSSDDNQWSLIRDQELPGIRFEGTSSIERVRTFGFSAGAKGSAPVAPIPEPSTYASMLGGLLALVWFARRRATARH